MKTFLDLYTQTRIGGMPTNVLVYTALMLACWGYAVGRGGVPERIGATILVVASFLTAAVIDDGRGSFRGVEIGVVVVDILCSLAFVLLALHADRFWCLWIAALQIGGTMGHAVKFVDPGIIPRAYAFTLAIWAYPMLVLLVAGTWRHQRRLARFGVDKSWSGAKAAY